MSGLVLGAVFPSAQDIAKAIIDAIGKAILALLGNPTAQSMTAPFEPLIRLLVTTDPQTTYANQAVTSTWQVMVVVANALLAVFIMTGGLQMMIGRATGTVYLPPQEFFPKLFAVALAVNFSLLFGHILIDINNALCALTQFDMVQFIASLSKGNQNGQVVVLFILSLIFVIVFLFTIFQLVGRLVVIDLLLVLSPLWMLMWLLPQTKPYAEFSSRVLTVTIFEQAIQLIAFTVAAKFLVSAGFKDPITMLIIGTGMLFTIGNIPRILGRLKGVYGGVGSGGLGTMIGAAVRVGMMLAA